MKTINDLLVMLLKGEAQPYMDNGTGAIGWVLNDQFHLELHLPEYARRPFRPLNIRTEGEHRLYTVLKGELTSIVYAVDDPTPGVAPNFVVQDTHGVHYYAQPLVKEYHVHQASTPTAPCNMLATDFRQFLTARPTLVLVQKLSELFANVHSLQKYPWLHEDTWMGTNTTLMCNHLHASLMSLSPEARATIEEALK